MKELTNEQKQVLLSGILGDGCLRNGRAYFSCIHKEYMDLKKKLLGDLALLVEKKRNDGYKKGAFIFKLDTLMHPQIKEYQKYTVQQIVNELDELGIALLIFDDGSRHKKNNFYNINTHAQTREDEQDVIIPFLNKFDVYPTILTEAKKDGRIFSYLYVSKWNGAMVLSRMLRKFNLECYAYKLMPIEMENAYFEVKDKEDFLALTTPLKRTNYIKDYLNIERNKHMYSNVTSTEMVFTDSSKL